MKVIILGCGRIGSTLATSMSGEGHSVTVIDRQSSALKRLDSGFTGETIVGNGIDEDILAKAGIEGADAFIAVTNGDNTNIMSVQIAKEKFHVAKCIARVYDPIRACAYQELGVEVFCTTLVGARMLKDRVQGKELGMGCDYCALENTEV